MSGLLSREAILAAEDLPHVDVAVPEWGGTIRIRTMTGADREEYERWLADAPGDATPRQMRERLVALCAIDADGNRLFSSNGGVAELSGKNFRPLARLAMAAIRQNVLTSAGVEEQAKNSDAAPSGATTSA